MVMRKIKRAVHFDFHNLPALPDLGDDFSAERFVKTLVDSKVKYINFFARCNLGYSYFPTKVGVPHPYLKGRDIFGELLAECHRNDIGVTAYFNGSLSQDFADHRREWTVVDENGQVVWGDRTGYNLRHMCYNTGYGDHLVAEVSELLELYPDVDGIFMDCFSFPKPCYGHECVELMKAEGIDIEDKAAVLNFNVRKIIKMARRISAVVPEDKYFFINGALPNKTCFFGRTELDTHSEIECLATGGWGYDYFPAKAALERNLFDDVVFMTGRFHRSWGDFGGLREKAGFEFDAYSALAAAVNISVGDHLPPRGLPEPAVFDIIREIYTELEKTEPWTDNVKYVPEIAVMISKNDWRPNYTEESLPEGVDTARGMYAVRGAVRMLAELKYQFDVITDDMDFSGYKLLILPDCMTLSGETAKKLSAYIKNGGKVLSSGSSGLSRDLSGFAASEWNFEYDGPEPWNASYFKACEELAADMPDMVTAIYAQGIALAPKNGNTVLADYWEPYFNRHWDGYQGYFYTPYSKKSDKYAAILQQDSVVHINFKIFGDYNMQAYPSHKKVVAACIKRLYSGKLLKTNVPVFARTSLTVKDNYLILHTLSYCPEQKGSMGIIEEGIKIYDNEFYIAWDKAPKKAYLVPYGEPVSFSYANGRIELRVPRIDSHAIIAMEF
jgi:hypothetical protein